MKRREAERFCFGKMGKLKLECENEEEKRLSLE